MTTAASLITRSADNTMACGQRLGELLRPGDVVFLEGDIGSGKTTLCKGIARGVGIDDEITSPTFTLISEYEGRVPLAHMDLYRLADERAVQGIGVEDYLQSDAVVLVEWPGALRAWVDDALTIHMRVESIGTVDNLAAGGPSVQSRVIECSSSGPRSASILVEWVKTWQSL